MSVRPIVLGDRLCRSFMLAIALCVCTPALLTAQTKDPKLTVESGLDQATLGTAQTDAASPIVVSVRQAGASPTIARNQCLTINAGDDAAYECGDLRLVYALPTTTTLSRPRTPTLIYNSRHHSGLVLFPADVSISPGAQVTRLIARIQIDGQPPETTTFAWNPQWTSTMRIVVPYHAREKGLATGAYHYTLTVDAISGGSAFSSQDDDTVAVVNRSSSEFGSGWWLDGYERLVFPAAPNHVLWVGGDGSTRLYRRVGTSNVWLVNPTMDRPDSLVYGNGWWYRRLRSGAYVMFDGSGLHVATVDSKQRVTWFNHEDAQHPTWLTSITLPVPIGSSAVRRYVFGHDGGSPTVTWIDAPGVPSRRVRLTSEVAPDGSSVLGRITDPDGTHFVRFTYVGAGRLATRIDRRSHTTTFAFDSASLSLVGSTLDMAGTAAANISLGFCGAESASLSACARGPVDTSRVMTRFDGPRLPADVLDSAWFKVTRYGAPSLITDALRNVTRIARTDTHWPLLATQTTDPAGFTTTATYDSLRALLLATTAISPRSRIGSATADSAATTIYTWHPTRDVVRQVLSPVRVLTQYVYDARSGDLTSQHAGTGTKRQVDYSYDPATRLPNAVTTRASWLPTRYHYDALGNVDTTRTPRGFVSSVVHDYIGRDSIVRTPIEDIPTVNWRQQTYTYDVNDRLRVATDSGRSAAPNSSVKLTVINDYDEESNLTSVTRRATPDSLRLGDVILTSSYDAANRKTSEIDPTRGATRSWIYDPAGNATLSTRGGNTVMAEFDALNRPVHRVVPGVGWSPTPEAATDDQRFYYGARGELLRATNVNGEVRRTYNLAGAVVSDTSIVFATALSTPSANQHVYGLGFTYDLDGRRTSLTPPAGLGVLSPVSYLYDSDTGDLTTLTIQNGGTFRYVYTEAGLLDSLVQADGTVEHHYYDDDAREIRRTEYSVALQQMLHDEHVALDGRGRRTVVGFGPSLAGGLTEQYTYDGLDGVIRATGRSMESTPRDPFGNALRRVSTTEDWTEQYRYEPNSTRLHYLARQIGDQRFDSVSHSYNLAGDLGLVIDQITGPQACPDPYGGRGDCEIGVGTRRVIARSMLRNVYDADGHLLQSVKETTNDDSGTWPDASIRDPNWFEVYSPFERGVTEEYRYDALGRRIWVRAHRDAYCPTQRDRDSTTVCLSTVERTIYDGDQVLAEIRQPGNDDAPAWVLESDGAAAGSPEEHFGQVGYVHGLGIDRPLELSRNYGGVVTRLVTHYQWQGALELGTTLSGQLIQCGVAGAVSPCEDIDWPGAKIRFGMVIPHRSLGPASWWGTMAGMKENATGMRDVRNRQYDPKTGRFTQEDPIGLAGGMNLYGFAQGDPVNFSDPLGLWPWPDLATAGGGTLISGAALGELGLGGPVGWIAAGGLAIAGALDYLAGPSGAAAFSTRAATDASSVVRERRSGRSLKREWEGMHDQPWPVGCVAHHDCPLADGGIDNATNIVPLAPDDHVELHKSNGDFKRWGSRTKKETQPPPQPPPQEPKKPEPQP